MTKGLSLGNIPYLIEEVKSETLCALTSSYTEHEYLIGRM